MTGERPERPWGVPAVEGMPEPVRLLAVVLCTATRIEPELVRAVRIEVRPDLGVSAEAALWFGTWSLRSSARYMALDRNLLGPLREMLRAELARSADDALVREAGNVIFRVHERHLSPTLALEEQVTWAAVRADAGLGPREADADIDRLLERVLRAAVEVPARRESLRRWFAGAWQRFPDRVRQTPAALELFAVLGGEESRGRGGTAGQGRGAHLDGVEDVILAVRHDGAHLTVGDPRWPAQGIHVPDTQPRVLEVASGIETWREAERLRVPRGGRMTLPVSHVPVFVRNARGTVYEVGAHGVSDVLAYAARSTAGSPHRGLLGSRVAELRDDDALAFGIAPRLLIRYVGARAAADPGRWVQKDLVPRVARASDIVLPLFLQDASRDNGLVVVSGGPSSGRTRAAWEALRQALGDWWVWAPPLIGRSRAVVDAVADDRIGSHTVLWLDDLDRMLIGDAGEDLARALLKVLDDPAVAPVLMLATAEPSLAAGKAWGPAARVLIARASFVQAATGKQGRAVPPGDAVSAVCERVVARAAAAEPGHRIETSGLLPERLEHFTGRARALERLHALLADRTVKRGMVAVLTGLPGSGKTALAVEAVFQARERGWFPGGVLWIDAAEQPFTAAVLLRALGVRASAVEAMLPGEAWLMCSALMHQVTAAGVRPALLVLDGVVPGDDAPLSRLAPGLSVLLTTRSQVPFTAELITVGPLSAEEAVSLLIRTVPAGPERDGPSDSPPTGLVALSDRCGRLPLALEAAASMLGTDPAPSVPALVLALDRAPVRADVFPPGRDSVRSALDWSYRRLSPREASGFRLLGLVPGGSFSAVAVLILTGSPPNRLLDRLTGLHLLQRSARDEGRWSINSLIQQHAADLYRQHAGRDERREALNRLMGYYEQWAREADAWTREADAWAREADAWARAAPRTQRIVFSSRQQAVAWMEEERESLVAAVDVCLREGLTQTGQAIALALSEFLTQTRQFDDLLRVMEAVLRAPEAEEADRYTRTAALNNFAVAMATTGDFEAAVTALQDTGSLSGETGDRSPVLALMLGNLGATLMVGRRYRDAVRVLTGAAERFTEIGDHAGLIQVLSNLGSALLEQGEVRDALACLERARLESWRARLSTHDQAVLLSTLGAAQLRDGRTEEGLATLDMAAFHAGRMGEVGGQGTVLERLGRAMLENHRFDEAGALFSRARDLYRKLGDPRSEARAGNNLGLALLESRQDVEGLHELERARDIHLSVGDALSAAQCLNNIGNALRRQGRHEEAIRTLNKAVGELREVGDERALAEALLNLGLSSVDAGETENAHAVLLDSAAVHQSLGDITSRAQALHALGRMAYNRKDPLALEYLRAATEAFRHGRDGPGLVDSLLLLSDLLNATGRQEQAQAALTEALRAESALERDVSARTGERGSAAAAADQEAAEGA